jgi:hypothetical protein
MIIKAKQFNALGNEIFKQFLTGLTIKMIAENPHWMNNESYEEKYKFIKEIVEYGQKENIYESDSLRKFTSYLIKFNQSIPLLPKFVNELRIANIDEEARVEELYLKLASNREKLILIEI